MWWSSAEGGESDPDGARRVIRLQQSLVVVFRRYRSCRDGCPVVLDVTHCLRLPEQGDKSGGNQFIPHLARGCGRRRRWSVYGSSTIPLRYRMGPMRWIFRCCAAARDLMKIQCPLS